MELSLHPVQYDVAYPERPLNRLTTAFRLLMALPIAIVLSLIAGVATAGAGAGATVVAGGSALLVLPPLLMIVFRRKYPRWWYDFNLELLRFHNRVGVYLSLMDDRYPSTDQRQSVRLDVPYPGARLSRGLPLVKWLLAIPHYAALVLLHAGAVLAVVAAWFAILVTGRFPRAIFDYLVGVGRWTNRVIAYAFILVTDEYPPFRLRP
jgi:hypothetical protein